MGVIIGGDIQMPNGEGPKPFSVPIMTSSEGKHSSTNVEGTSGGGSTLV